MEDYTYPKRPKHRLWLTQYLDNCHQLNRSEHTIKNYSADLKKFFIWFEENHHAPITKANGQTISRYKDFLSRGGIVFKRKKLLQKIFRKKENKIILHQEPLSINSKKRHLSAVKNYCEFLKQTYEDNTNLFLKNPVKSKLHTIKLKDIDVVHTKSLRSRDFQKIEDRIYRTNERLKVYLLYYGGLRLSELTELKTKDFNHQTHYITIKRKGGSIHQFRPQKAQKIFNQLDFYLKTHKSEYLFTNKKGQKLSTRAVYAQIKKILKKSACQAGLSPHSFRKACATNLYMKTKDLLFVRDYLNHKDAKVTQTYIDPETLHGVIKEKDIIN